MSDPLSVTASVAGVISLGAATTKLFYRFVSSIGDAPREVQAITSSLYGVNIALCQIQTLLLDLTYAPKTVTDDLGDLEQSVLFCVASFNVIENWLENVCPNITENILTTKRAWQQIKYVFQKDGLKEALERLDNEKGTLQLIISTLNSKSMAQVITVVRNAERAVQRNTKVIKQLELKITRQLQDAIGRSHITTSSISLDSICTQDEIERLLTNSDSALSLTLSDVSDDAASIIFTPDTLSGVDSSLVRIKFSTADDEGLSKDSLQALNVTKETRFGQPAADPNEAGVPIRVESCSRRTVDSYFDLADTLSSGGEPQLKTEVVGQSRERESKKHESVPILAPKAQHRESPSMAQRIMYAIKTNRLAPIRMEEKSKEDSFGISLGNFFAAASLIHKISKLLTSSSVAQQIRLKNVERCIERFEFYMALFDSSGSSSIENRYLPSCFQNARSAITQYGIFVEKVYGDMNNSSQSKISLVQTIQGSSSRFQELWLKVEASMNELDRSISFQVMMKQHHLMQDSINHQLEVLKRQENLDEKVECSRELILAAISGFEGDRDPNSQPRQKNQRRRTGGRIRKSKASTSQETKDRSAENGRTPKDSESTGKVVLDDWESCYDDKA